MLASFCGVGFHCGLCSFFLNTHRHGGFFSLPFTVPGKWFYDGLQPNILRTKVSGSGLLLCGHITLPKQELTQNAYLVADCAVSPLSCSIRGSLFTVDRCDLFTCSCSRGTVSGVPAGNGGCGCSLLLGWI